MRTLCGAQDRATGHAWPTIIGSNMSPDPGSPTAVSEGCICPTVLNRHGRGTSHGEPLFYCDRMCPLHRGKGAPDESTVKDNDHRWLSRHLGRI
jgi:hypothetical protein